MEYTEVRILGRPLWRQVIPRQLLLLGIGSSPLISNLLDLRVDHGNVCSLSAGLIFLWRWRWHNFSSAILFVSSNLRRRRLLHSATARHLGLSRAIGQLRAGLLT